MSKTPEAAAPTDRPSVPIVLGVVGHRALRPEDDERLRASVASILAGFLEAYPHCPLVLLSALAEGADQLAAEVALALKTPPGAEARMTVRAPLPFPKEVYLQTSSFSGTEAQDRFASLTAHPRVEWFVAPLPDGPSPGDLQAWYRLGLNENDRRTCYANAGGYILRNSVALIALWDDEPGQPSGTGELVSFKLTGRPPQYYPWRQPLLLGGENGPVYCIHTPRKGAESGGRAGEILLRLPGVEKPVDPREMKHDHGNWTHFKRRVVGKFVSPALGPETRKEREIRGLEDACAAAEDFNKAVRSEGRDLDEAMGLPEELPALARNKAFVRVDRLRSAADLLAVKLEHRLFALELAMFGSVFVSALLFHFYAHWYHIGSHGPAHRPVLLALSMLALLAAALIVSWVWLRRLDERRLDYRAFAEALRVRFYWGLAGIGESIADSYLRQVRSEMSWIRGAVENSCPPAQTWSDIFEGRQPEERCACLEAVRSEWVDGQKKYYRETHLKKIRRGVCLRLVGFVCALAGWLLALLMLFRVFDPVHPSHGSLIASGAVVILGGLLIALKERRSFEELARLYDRLAVVFERAREELEEPLRKLSDTRGSNREALAGAQAVLTALGREALHEHAQWLILRRAWPFDLQIGG